MGLPTSSKTTKVLGVNWDFNFDQFYYDVQQIIDLAGILLPSKRSLLKIAAKVFDHLGHLSLFTLF